MKEFKKIKASCPICGADKDKIVYHNAGPIVGIYCSECKLSCNEGDAKESGFKDLIDFWNAYFSLKEDGKFALIKIIPSGDAEKLDSYLMQPFENGT